MSTQGGGYPGFQLLSGQQSLFMLILLFFFDLSGFKFFEA
jgi:hypothetical protein